MLIDGERLPFDEDTNTQNQKAFIGTYNTSSLFGFPSNIGGFNRQTNFAFTKRGVAMAYMLVPVLKAAVDVISENLASIPMVMKDKSGKVVLRSDGFGHSESKFLSAIEKSYSYYGLPLMQLWCTSILLYGENFTEKVPNTMSELNGLKWLNPLAMSVYTETVYDTVDIVIGGKGRYQLTKKYIYSGQNGTVPYDESELLFSRAYNPIDDIHGYSSALSALAKASISMEFEDFTLAFYNNSGHPGVIISPKDKLVSNKDTNSWQKDWEEKFRGSHNQFKTHINSFPFDVYTFDVLDISQPLEVSKDAEHKILSAFRVPPEMIGLTQDNNYQFSKETKNGFMQTAVRPIALSIANSINHSGIIQEFDSEAEYKFSFDFSEFDAKGESDLRQQDILERQVKSTAISLGTYQRATGNEVSSPEADKTYLVPQGFVVATVEQLKNPSELMQQPTDQRGPDASSLNQSPRETQSRTGEQESTEFFGSKFYNTQYDDEDFDITKNNVKKKISIKDIQDIATNKNISLVDALNLFEEFDGDY